MSKVPHHLCQFLKQQAQKDGFQDAQIINLNGDFQHYYFAKDNAVVITPFVPHKAGRVFGVIKINNRFSACEIETIQRHDESYAVSSCCGVGFRFDFGALDEDEQYPLYDIQFGLLSKRELDDIALTIKNLEKDNSELSLG